MIILSEFEHIRLFQIGSSVLASEFLWSAKAAVCLILCNFLDQAIREPVHRALRAWGF